MQKYFQRVGSGDNIVAEVTEQFFLRRINDDEGIGKSEIRGINVDGYVERSGQCRQKRWERERSLVKMALQTMTSPGSSVGNGEGNIYVGEG